MIEGVVEFIPNSYTYLTFEELIGLIPCVCVCRRESSICEVIALSF